MAPLADLFAPVFFVLLGMQVDVGLLLEPRTLLMSAAFLVAAVLGKVVAGAVAGRGIARLAVGIGMLPRGEVGLIFLTIGRSLGIVRDDLFAALVGVVVVTTIATPPALRWAFGRTAAAGERPHDPSDGPASGPA